MLQLKAQAYVYMQRCEYIFLHG